MEKEKLSKFKIVFALEFNISALEVLASSKKNALEKARARLPGTDIHGAIKTIEAIA